MRTYQIPKPMSVREALHLLYPESSRRTLQNWLQSGRFSVDGKSLKREDVLLKAGQILSSQKRLSPRAPGLNLLYADRYLIAIEKPSGLLSVPLDEGKSCRHALGLLRDGFQTASIFPVHRIDREVSGVLLFARGKESEERLKILFEKHDLVREYFAIVEGNMKENEGTWKSPLTEVSTFRVIPSPEGKKAVTHFKVEKRSPKYTYLRIVLETGRKHQIRVHCQMGGYPILGDFRYGAKESPIGRLCLHAVRLALTHPFTGQPLVFYSPFPSSFRALGVYPAEYPKSKILGKPCQIAIPSNSF